ncbi:hypothetical protein PVAND_011469 [Polypedilum vanderplanki]|uniref:Chromo domain-containing protein n=1 Tax=Polypedilum vanderplanki TaxID=319348 RepID=A0A9J6CIP2_POLVA|nr:hypothetical protein PVAND_011469 [Polypedilum vanderplanki]
MSQVKFSDGEKVLCYHGSLIYEAKLLKTQVKDRTIKYYIHYAGWSKNWDEWVPENRVLKYNEANVQLQKEIQQKVESSTKSTKKASKSNKKAENTKDDATSRSSTPSKDMTREAPRSRGSSVKPTTLASTSSSSTSKEATKTNADDDSLKMRKRPRLDTNASNEGSEEKVSRPEITIAIPKDLKSRLVDDWHMINLQNKLVDLPAKITVDDIVKQYVQYKKTKSNSKGVSCEDISNGILEYFNVMLGSQLLYKVERTQYSDILNEFPDKPMSQIYGSFHLLRLFVKLGSVLSFTTLDKNNIRILIGHLGDFLKFLESKADEYFLMSNFSYVPQTSEYLRRNQ